MGAARRLRHRGRHQGKPPGECGGEGFSPVLTMTMMSQLCSDEEHKGVDMVIDRGTLQAGLLKRAVVFSES